MQKTDAPTIHVSRRDFNGPFGEWYASVERLVQCHGIVKVKSPKGWQPRESYKDIEDFLIRKPVEQSIRGRVEDGVFRATQIEVRGMKVSKFREKAKERAFKPSRRGCTSRQDLEKAFWQTVTNSDPLYGADVPGSFFEEDIQGWNINNLDCMLTKVLNSKGKKIPGVNTAYLYFGTWRSTFPWHTEDKDLASINYLHFGAPKMWYCIPPKDREKFENLMRSKFTDVKCPEFLRHKEYLAMPSWLEKHGIQVIKVLQEPGEFIISAPGAYHSGFNLGFNCAESTNFATESWLKFGVQASSCNCRADTVKIDMRIFLDVAPPKMRKAIRDCCPSPSPPGSEISSEDASSSGVTAAHDASLDSDSEDGVSSSESKPCPKNRGRPAAATQPAKRARKVSPVTVLPTRKRGRPPSCNQTPLGRAVALAQAPAAVSVEEVKRRRVGELRVPQSKRSVVAEGQAAGPMQPARRTGVALVRTTSQARSVGRPGSRMRVLAMMKARAQAGIFWDPKPKAVLPKGKPGRSSELKPSCTSAGSKLSVGLRQVEASPQVAGVMPGERIRRRGRPGGPRLVASLASQEGPGAQHVPGAGPGPKHQPTIGSRPESGKLSTEGRQAQASTQDLGSLGKTRGRHAAQADVRNVEGTHLCSGEPCRQFSSTSAGAHQPTIGSDGAPSGSGRKAVSLPKKRGGDREGSSSLDTVGPVMHYSRAKDVRPRLAHGTDGPPFTPSKRSPANDLARVLEEKSPAVEGPHVVTGNAIASAPVIRTSKRFCKPTLKKLNS